MWKALTLKEIYHGSQEIKEPMQGRIAKIYIFFRI